METTAIDRDDLKAALARGGGSTLAMAISEWAFQAARIPSLRRAMLAEHRTLLGPAEHITVHGSGVAGHVGRTIIARRIRRYAGGLADWTAAGEPLAGAHVA